MVKQSFSSIYSEYTKAYNEKKHAKCLEILPRFDWKSSFPSYPEQVYFLLRSASYCLVVLKKSNAKNCVLIANAYKDVLCVVSKGSDYDNLFLTLSNFLTHSERFLALVSGLSSTESNEFLQAINKCVFQVLKNAQIVDDAAHTKRKEIYLQLTQALLSFVNADAKQGSLSSGSWKFDESRSFLSHCQQFSLFHEGEQNRQYKLCFEMLDKLLVAISSETGKGKLGQAMEAFLKDLKSLTKSTEVRATLTQDNFVTVAKILKACTTRFVQSSDAKNMTGCLKVLEYVGQVTKQVKSTKPFCTDCDGIGKHCTHELAQLASEMYTILIEKDIDEPIEVYANIVQNNLDAVSKLNCAKALDAQRNAVSKVQSLGRKCETAEKAKFMIPVIKAILKRHHKFKLMDQLTNFDMLYILNNFFKILNTTDRSEELIDVAYLYMAFYSAASNHSTSNLDHIVYTMAKKQKEIKTTKTPYDYFSESTEEFLYGLKLPDNFDVDKVSLDLLKVGFKYNVLSPELTSRTINQLLKTSTKNPNSLRFTLFVQSLTFDKETSDRVDKLVNSLHAKSKKDASVALQLAALKYLRLNYEAAQMQEKYVSLSITEALSEAQLALQTSVFRDVTFDQEKCQIETLRYVKDGFIGFVSFYLSKTTDERKQFDDEKELLLRELKIIANQFVVRGYTEDGLELYMALFRLSKEIQDEFGLIDACSFFAENSCDFRPKFPRENLKSIIEDCFAACVEKLKDLNNLTTRKQNQVCFCILNLVLFYYEDGGNYDKEINLILAFIFKIIGGTDDKKIEETMEALIGKVEKVKTNSNETKKSLSEAVRIKFYSILFTIVTKYGAPTAFHPTKFIQFVMNHIKTYLSIYHDSTVAVPILLYNMIPQMIMWLESHYQLNVDVPALVMTLLKLSLKSGFANRTVNLMLVLLQMDLTGEKLTSCKLKFQALEYVILSDAPSSPEQKRLESPVFAVDDKGNLCEPIRKEASVTSPMMCLSPKQVTVGSLTTQSIRYLPIHRSGCACGVCFSLQNKLLIFCVAVAYARFVYINEEAFDTRTKRAVFAELIKYWEKCRKEKTLPKSDLYYLVSARMLLYDGHFRWKFEKDYTSAVEQLERGLKGLERVKNGADSLKSDLHHQVDRMRETKEMTREERYSGTNYISRHKRFEDLSEDEPKKKPVTKAAPKSQTAPMVFTTPKPRVNLFDMINKDLVPAVANFQIHDDEAAGATQITPSVKRTTRAQKKKVNELPVRKEAWVDNEGGALKTKTVSIDTASNLPMPKRNFKRHVPSVQIDLTTPPETNAEKANSKSTPETPVSSNPPQILAPRKAKCPPHKDARKIVNESHAPRK